MRKAIVCVAICGVVGSLGGCMLDKPLPLGASGGKWVPLGANPDDELTLRLNTFKEVYCEYEPVQLALMVQNSGEDKKKLPFGQSDGVVLAGRPEDDVMLHYSFRVGPEGSWPRELGGGQTRMIRLVNRSPDACLKTAGTWRLSYRCRGADARNDLYTSANELEVICVRQPLSLPGGPADAASVAMEALSRSPVEEIVMTPPAWTRVPYNQPMLQLKRLGSAATGTMLANLHNYSMQAMIVQVLGDVRAKDAVPRLLDLLKMDDGPMDHLIVASLSNITGIAEGYEFHRNWSQADLRPQVVRVFREWWEQNR